MLAGLPTPSGDGQQVDRRASFLAGYADNREQNDTLHSVQIERGLACGGVFPNNQNLLQDIECAMNMDNRLAQLPKTQRITKSKREYLTHAATITSSWAGIRRLCSQADVFHFQVGLYEISRGDHKM